jgi:hypothetical protein
MAKSASHRETLEQFMLCWEGLDDPRNGNAALHDFHELLVIALCAVLCGGQGRWTWLCSQKRRSLFCAGFWS